MTGRNGGDPAARGRIVAAATKVLGERGAGATYAEVAAAAGVAPELVEQYFPSVTDLRAAIDERVLTLAARVFEGMGTGAGDPYDDMADRVTRMQRDHPDELLYVARGSADGEPGALGIFDAFMAVATTSLQGLREEGLLDPEIDLEWAALHIVIFNLGTVLFEQAIDNHLPEGLRTPEGVERWHAADTELFRRGFLRPLARSR
jgi:TetR/AcrR family transcriptional regulator, regulator of cefoperazone and chloramphenicol sensitivity